MRFLTRKHRKPVSDEMFRMLLLTDDPFPTYIGQRAWCSGKPYWEDHTCECTHRERPDDRFDRLLFPGFSLKQAQGAPASPSRPFRAWIRRLP